MKIFAMDMILLGDSFQLAKVNRLLSLSMNLKVHKQFGLWLYHLRYLNVLQHWTAYELSTWWHSGELLISEVSFLFCWL